ncbi:MAG: amidohydrolase family protein [Alteromonadaceae bacterium]|nr:amidohydrolase family protein [Alteromonadaceae bacterium]
MPSNRAKIYVLVLVSLAIFVIALLPEPQVRTTPSFVLNNITLYDGATWHENAKLTIFEGKVINSEQAPKNLPTVDGKGQYVIPGLIDAHTHSWGQALEQNLTFGVTSVLDMFTDINFMRANQHSRQQTTLQARLFTAGTLVTSKEGHGTQFGIRIPTIENAIDADEFIAKRLQEGSDYIKIVYDAEPEKQQFGMRFTSISQDVLKAVVKATHIRNKLAVVHVMDEISALHAIESGADGLVHSFGNSIMSTELLSLLAQREVFVIPTNSVLASIGQQQRGRKLLQYSPLAYKVSSHGKSGLMSSFPPNVGNEEYWKNALENTRLMHRNGITVLAGTDAPNAGTTHGISLHDELAILVEAGMTPTDAIHSATGAVSDMFKLPHVGKLLPGFHADMIMLNEDPRIDIKHTQTIVKILLSGIEINEAELNDK